MTARYKAGDYPWDAHKVIGFLTYKANDHFLTT